MKASLTYATLAVACLAILTAITPTYADGPFVKLRFNNKAKIDVQVYVVDHIAKKTDENKRDITPNSSSESKAMMDKDGYIDIELSMVFRDPAKGSSYRCLPVRTLAKGQSTLTYDLTAESGKASRSC
jgi:hypothetical protein